MPAVSSVLRRMLDAWRLNSATTFLAIVAVMTGVPILLDPGVLAPSSILNLLPLWGIYAWGIGLTVGGVAAVLGIFFEEIRLERIGVTALGVTSGIFALALIGFLPRSFSPFVTYSMFSITMWGSFWKLTRLIRTQEYLIQNDPRKD